MKQIKTAIAGFGKSGKLIHAPLIRADKRFSLNAVVKRSGPDLIDGFRDVTLYRDYKTMLKDEQIELVVITAPNHLHFRMAADALISGKHVVVDKPFTVTHAEAEKLIRIARDEERVLTAFQNRRLDADFLTLKRVIENGAVGRITEFTSRFDRFRNRLREDAWKEKDLPGSGILYDLSPHLIDQALQLFGKPGSLFAEIRNERRGDVDDFFDIRLFYDGFTARLTAGMLVPEPATRFILRGMNGSFLKSGTDPQEAALAAGDDPSDPSFGVETSDRFGTLYKSENGEIIREAVPSEKGRYPDFYNNLCDVIAGNGELLVQPEEAAEVIRMIELAKVSHREGRVVSC